jgi:hypothetical protein
MMVRFLKVYAIDGMVSARGEIAGVCDCRGKIQAWDVEGENSRKSGISRVKSEYHDIRDRTNTREYINKALCLSLNDKITWDSLDFRLSELKCSICVINILS